LTHAAHNDLSGRAGDTAVFATQARLGVKTQNDAIRLAQADVDVWLLPSGTPAADRLDD
jgi:hypothetical protein